MTATVLQGRPQSIYRLAHAYVAEGRDESALNNALTRLAKAVLCQNNGESLDASCGQCKSCSLIAAGHHPDLLMLGEDGSIGIDEIRSVTEFLFKTPQISGRQVILLFNTESLTENASNALLKTLEEPTANSYLLLQVADKGRLMPTILSRCQFLHFEGKAKDVLLNEYAELPNYIVGFAKGSESNIRKWMEESYVEKFEQVYASFINWLKGQEPKARLIHLVINEPTLQQFLVYLLERRTRQLLLKPSENERASAALRLLNEYNFTQNAVKGQNRNLALTAFLQKIEVLIR